MTNEIVVKETDEGVHKVVPYTVFLPDHFHEVPSARSEEEAISQFIQYLSALLRTNDNEKISKELGLIAWEER